jgi:transcriptional regulator with XRE-family HTH domain
MRRKKSETFAGRLEALREAAGLSQYRLAQLAGLSKQNISRLELGYSEPSFETVLRLAAALRVEVMSFAYPLPPMDPPPVKRAGRPRKDRSRVGRAP